MNKVCRVCGKEYEVCLSCEKNGSWRALTDTADHYYILTVLMDYKSKRDAKVAYAALTKRGIDPSKTDEYIPAVKCLMEEISSSVTENSRMQTEQVELEIIPVTRTSRKKIKHELEE